MIIKDTDPPTPKELENLKTYGFRIVVISKHMNDGEFYINHDINDNPVDTLLICNSNMANKIKLFMLTHNSQTDKLLEEYKLEP